MTDSILYSSAAEDFQYIAINIPCQNACPAQTNIPAYIRALFENNPDRSYEINQMANILPGVLGRICSRPCEAHCRHGESELGEPVNICHIKRAAGDFKTHVGEPIKFAKENGLHVAVIGAGPAGLAAAHDLALFGFKVTLFEGMEHPGGMLRYGIPKFRLPRDILNGEIKAIENLGVKIKTNVKIGEEITVEQLMAYHDAVLAAVGCYQPIPLEVPGEDLKGVYSGLTFMMDVCSGKQPEVGKSVLVIGAGFTAFDCARSALRLGAETVTICLRRTEEDLTVTHDEVLETKREGIKIQSLMVSQSILGENSVTGVEFIRTQPGEKRSDGKREITQIPGSEFKIQADTVIVATGQRPGPFGVPGKNNEEGVLDVDKITFQSAIQKLYGTGDYISGPSTVIEAIAKGRQAAHRIAADLSGNRFYEPVVQMENYSTTDRKRIWDFLPRQEMPTLMPPENRIGIKQPEVETGYPKEMALEEAKRCYLCYLHYEIDMDRCIYCRYCIDVAPRDCIKLVKDVKTNPDGTVIKLVETTAWEDVNAIIIDNSRCIRCGECLRICPVDCISATKIELVEKPLGAATETGAENG